MKLNEAKLGTPVIYWFLIKGINKSIPYFGVIMCEPYTLDYGHITGPYVVKISDQDLPVALNDLTLITPEIIIEINKRGFDIKDIANRPELNNLQRRQINWFMKYQFSHQQFKQMPAMPTAELDAEMAEMDRPKNPIKPTPEQSADYEPYGPEWEAELMKMPKKAIIELYKALCITWAEHKKTL